MLTWQIDRILRAGPLCAVATFVIPALLAVFVNAISSLENVLGLLLIGSLVIGIGGLVGSVITAGFGTVLFSLGVVVAEVPAWVVFIAGAILFATMMVQDLAGSLRRGSRINTSVWRITAATTALIVTIAGAAFALTFLVARLATWQAIVVPFGIAGLGFGAKLAADSHLQTARQLTVKRKQTEPVDFGD